MTGRREWASGYEAAAHQGLDGRADREGQDDTSLDAKIALTERGNSSRVPPIFHPFVHVSFHPLTLLPAAMKWNLQSFLNKASYGSLPGEAFCVYTGAFC
jgi:hypothetical protein